MSMQKQERRRKFHESLLNMLYTPPPPPPPPLLNEIPEEHQQITLKKGQHISDDLGDENSSVSASDVETEVDTQKLTRAQRKRLRKKRLKEAVLNRRKIIGPELPTSTNVGNDQFRPDAEVESVNNITQAVRRNAAEGLETDSGIEQHPVHQNLDIGDTSSCTSQKRRKQRRASRKMAKDWLKPLAIEDSDPPTCSDTNNEALTHFL